MTHDDEDGGTCFGLMACLLLSLSWLVVVALKRGWGTEGGSCHLDHLMVEVVGSTSKWMDVYNWGLVSL
ncbi:hypothetical protein WN943_006550 [Citrus x changshan-huyou]